MRKLSVLSPFGNLSHSVFFSVDLSIRRRRPMNITGAVAGKPRIHHIKAELCFNVLALQIIIACDHVCFASLVLCSHPYFARSKNLKGPP